MVVLFYFIVSFVLVKILTYDKDLAPFFIAAIIIRIVFLAYHLLGESLPDSGNAFMFHEHALHVSKLNYGELLTLMLLFDQELYPTLLGTVYKFFETPMFAGELINILFSFGSVIYSYRIALVLTGNKFIAKKSAKLLLFVPFLSIYSVILLREAIFVFFLTGAVLFFAVVIEKKRNINKIIQGSLFLIGAVAIQPGAAGAIVGLSFFSLFGSKRGQTGHSKNARVAFLIVGFITIWVILASEIGSYKLTKYMNDPTDVGFRVSERSEQRADVYLSGTYSENLGILVYLFRPFEFIIRPLFFEISGFFSVLRIIESMFITVAISVLFFKWRIYRKNEVFVFVLFFFLGVLAAFSLGSEEVAQGFRHKAKLYPIIVPLYLSLKSFTVGRSAVI